jgi:fructokinase
MSEPFNIIGIGEILWDLLPAGKKLGGAPANFAYAANSLGDRAVILSRVGNDESGGAIWHELNDKNLTGDFLQIDEKYPTGSVNVSLADGQPSYRIVEPVAWDFLELSDDWRKIAARADAVCFGSLAQRHEVSRQTILEFVKLTQNLRVFDVNLRQHFFSASILQKSFRLANVVKLNQEELPVVAKMFELVTKDPLETAKTLLFKFDLQLICVTRGALGSILITKSEVSENPGFEVPFKDAIGAGDAFTAALTHGLLRGWSLSEINDFANGVGAFVASESGAMPEFPEEFLP